MASPLKPVTISKTRAISKPMSTWWTALYTMLAGSWMALPVFTKNLWMIPPGTGPSWTATTTKHGWRFEKKSLKKSKIMSEFIEKIKIKNYENFIEKIKNWKNSQLIMIQTSSAKQKCVQSSCQTLEILEFVLEFTKLFFPGHHAVRSLLQSRQHGRPHWGSSWRFEKFSNYHSAKNIEISTKTYINYFEQNPSFLFKIFNFD